MICLCTWLLKICFLDLNLLTSFSLPQCFSLIPCPVLTWYSQFGIIFVANYIPFLSCPTDSSIAPPISSKCLSRAHFKSVTLQVVASFDNKLLSCANLFSKFPFQLSNFSSTNNSILKICHLFLYFLHCLHLRMSSSQISNLLQLTLLFSIFLSLVLFLFPEMHPVFYAIFSDNILLSLLCYNALRKLLSLILTLMHIYAQHVFLKMTHKRIQKECMKHQWFENWV